MRNATEQHFSNWTGLGYKSCDRQVRIISLNRKKRQSKVIHIVTLWQWTKDFCHWREKILAETHSHLVTSALFSSQL